MQCRWTVNHTTCCCLSWLHIYIVDRIFFQTQGINKILLIYINFSFDFLSQNHLISLGFLMNMNVYMHSDHMLFTTFAFVLHRIYNDNCKSWLNNTVILAILCYHVNSAVTGSLSQQPCNSLWYFTRVGVHATVTLIILAFTSLEKVTWVQRLAGCT